jgi:glycosyltransferase involved in cell wall biosynthesis
MRSVVIATYQGASFIEPQLLSILPQLAPDDEVIVSDDASSDRTAEIVASIRDSRIRLLANTDRLGYIANFERAIGHSHGELIYFSDQDDVWLPEKVSSLDAALLHSPCVASDAIVVDSSLNVLHASFFEWRGAKSFSTAAVFMRPSIIGATLACRRDYLDSLRPFPEGVPHDFWVTLNAAWDRHLLIIDKPLILYRRHAQVASITATGEKRSALTIAAERFAIARAMLRHRLFRRKSPRASSG